MTILKKLEKGKRRSRKEAIAYAKLVKKTEDFRVTRAQRVFDNSLVGKKDLIGAEIGVFWGYGAREMLKKLDIKTLYLIDPWQDYEEYDEVPYMKNTLEEAYLKAKQILQPYEDKLIWIRNFSLEASKLIVAESLDFAYVDANHSYNYARPDVEIWSQKVKKGGLVAGHDYWLHEGVRRAVEEYCQENHIFLNRTDSQDENVHNRKDDWWFIKE